MPTPPKTIWFFADGVWQQLANNIGLLSTGGGGGSGVVMMPGLPTSDPHVVGQVWNNSGVLTVSAG
jgi:hypothetical protein